MITSAMGMGLESQIYRGDDRDRYRFYLYLLVWFSEQQSLLKVIRIERELSDLVGIKIDLLTEQAISPYLIDRIKQELVDGKLRACKPVNLYVGASRARSMLYLLHDAAFTVL